ncbi:MULTISPECIES: hypothetical protein [unclassified Pseudomonas]|uniref:hypothetical protein n=1 Tax=unclassified Pseudomonas TaxID=196821 RepID=UPI00146465E5|nr:MULTISPECIES: hypothetical protein [unclassified Pseudomonas]QJQ22926.1 hypothetical protein HG549_24325 [Pseudomonas sp. SK]UPK88519.1 hypothetical protein E5221_27710 [Pseudomonas sp. A2]
MDLTVEGKKIKRLLPSSAELLMWFIVPFALILRLVIFLPPDYRAIDYLLGEYYWDVIVSILLIVFPIFFRQIFASLPLEYLLKDRSSTNHSVVNVGGDYFATSKASGAAGTTAEKGFENSSGRELLFIHAERSRSLAKGIYGRSGVYLLLGVLVAFSGLVFFYSQTAKIDVPNEVGNLLLLLAPKFGILFFIEFVAFFFLRQYRSAMDEFRYYESIARRREEVSALLLLSAESEPQINPMELIKRDSYFSKVSALEKDQSTEILEARKLEKGELELLEKVVDTLAKVKR